MFNRVIVAVVGGSNSGKTTAVEALIRGLTKRGYTVTCAKHIPNQPEFTIDTEGKDTWRYAKAGANSVLSVALNELTVIKKVDTTEYSLEQVVAETPEADIILLEGFKDLVGQDSSIPKLVTAKTVNEIHTALERYKNILAFVTSIPDEEVETKISCVDVLKEPEKLVDLVNNKVAVLVERKRKREEKITIQIDEKFVPLGDFVQDIIRNAVLAMVSSLKGAKIKGEEKVSIVVKRLSRG